MFKLELCDRDGNTLQQGDIVKVSNGKDFTFYSEVKYIGDGNIAPFSTFSFHSFKKVDKLPDNAVQGSEERYKIWWTGTGDVEKDIEITDRYSKYLIDWRNCETNINNKCFKITPL